MPELDYYHEFCDRICTHLMSYELGIPFQWDTPLPTTGNGRRGSGVQEDIRLTVINRQIHYYQRLSEGEEYEIQLSGPLLSCTELLLWASYSHQQYKPLDWSLQRW